MASITMSMNIGWSFHLGDVELLPVKTHSDIYNSAKAGSARGVPQFDFDTRSWETVNLPHDFSVKQPFDENGCADWGYKPGGKAWYRKVFMLPPETEGKHLTLEFDGVATNSVVYFNGSVLKRSFSGYAPFSVDISDRAVFGSPNVIAVFVDADAYEGWWYEGAGIYRDVRLIAKEHVSIPQYGVFVNPTLSDEGWVINIETKVENTSYQKTKAQVVTEITDDKGEVFAFSVTKPAEIPDGRTVTLTQRIDAEDPELWDVDNPVLYTAISRVYSSDNVLLDEVKTKFGFRTVAVDCNKGFLLNGKPVKLFGTCNHQDHAGIGTAVPQRVWEYRIKRLKEMGSNAYRCAHGMPSPALLDVCDRLGMMVLDENRNFETSDEVLSQLRTMVLRDRNHPSVIMYSIFNEEPLQSTPQGSRMAKRMTAEIKRLDCTRPVTGAMHGGILDENGAGTVMDICGVNYQINSYEAFREKYPDIPVFGSETTSAFSTRGCYKTNPVKNEIASYDEDCSDWGSTVRDTWAKALEHDYIAGAFMWTGFDYLGEPSPHVWPSVSSFFGMMDTCGFEKYGFLLSKAIFSKEPVCRMLPHWTHKDGEQVRVMSFTNCEEAELFINGRSQGRKAVIPTKQVYWDVIFESGEAEVRGYDRGKTAASEIVKTAGKPAKILLKPYCDTLFDDGEDAMTVDIFVVDENGIIVPDADNKIKISIAGGNLLGCANGDPNCHEEFTSNVRSAFHGLCQCVVSMHKGITGGMTIIAESEGLASGEIVIRSEKNPFALPIIDSVKEQYVQGWRINHTIFEEKPDPTVTIDDFDMNSWEPIAVENGSSPLFANCEGKYIMYRTKTSVFEAAEKQDPVLHFHQLWGRCEIYLNGELRATTESEWAMEMDVPLDGINGELEITVICRSMNKYGGGVTASVVIRR